MVDKTIKQCLTFGTTIIIILIFFAGTSLYLGYAWLQKDNQIYIDFLEDEKKAKPLLDELNETVAKSLPTLPVQSEIVEQWSVGIDNPLYQHGRWLFLKIYVPTEMGSFFRHYEPQLLQDGWQINPYRKHFEHEFYYKGTSCIELYFHLSYLRINIWHDFREQPFSPTFPNLSIMRFRELGETTIAICP